MASFNLTVEDSSPLVIYSPLGAWEDSPTDDTLLQSYSGQSYHRTSSQGATATVDFHGTGITLFGGNRQGYGSYTVTVDGQTIASSSASASTDASKQVLARVSGLRPGNHRATLTNVDGSPIDMDSVTISDEIGAPGSRIQVQNFDDPSPAFTYLPSIDVWSENRADSFQGGTLRFSRAPDAAVRMSFSGDAVAIYGTMSPDHTRAKLTLDGEEFILPGGVDHAESRLHTKVLLFFRGNLGPGQHTFTLAAEDSSSDAPFLDLDMVSVLSAVSPGDAPVVSQTQPSAVATPKVTGSVNANGSSSGSGAVNGSQDAPKRRVSSAAIAGSVVGGVVGLLLLLAICFFAYRWRQRRRRAPEIERGNLSSPTTPNLPMQQDPRRFEKGSSPLRNPQPAFIFPPKMSAYQDSDAHSIAPSYYGSPASGTMSLRSTSSNSPLIRTVQVQTPSPKAASRKPVPPLGPLPVRDEFVTRSISERLTRSPPRPSKRPEFTDFSQIRI